MNPIGDQLNIDTPELVSIEMPIAGIGSRFIGILVDSLIWSAAIVILVIVFAILVASVHFAGHLSENWIVGILFLILFLLQWGYFALFEAFNNGRTPGKMVAKIHVIHRSGRAVSFIEALARNLVRAIDYLPGFYTIGIIAIFVSKQNQRLGDMVAGTLVVRDHAIESPHWGELGTRTITAGTVTPVAPAAPHLSVVLSAPSVAKLSTADLSVLENFFSRRLDMDLTTRAALAERMAAALCAKSGLAIPEGISVETFLEAVAHQIREVGRVSSRPPLAG
ncbi:MAG TPA: RDD family protein [Terracidiphilus sp.]|nr:RDD family protein [Terracidiphilus sp.]